MDSSTQIDDIAKVACPMNGGEGPNSYAKNSDYQRVGIEASVTLLSDLITGEMDLACFSGKTMFRIADLGCSTGPNTFAAMKNIIEALNHKYDSPSQKALEFHVFFNDHVNNDFNTLFKNIPPPLTCFVAGVPGSFHGRLFPRSSMDIIHSSYSLHWLSKVPKEVRESTSQAWNNKEVTQAYFGQFQRDMKSFMKYRAEEIVCGGLMMIIIPVNGSDDDDHPPARYAGLRNELFREALNDMAEMGVIEKDKVKSFHTPVYIPTTNEMKYLIECTNFFSIEKTATWRHPYSPLFSAKSLAARERAAMEHYIRLHFGSEVIDQLYDIYAGKLEKNKEVFENDNSNRGCTYFLVLKRK